MHPKILFASLGLLLCLPSHGQQMYRCGSTYQDRPCDGPGTKLRVDGSGGGQAASLPKAAVDLQCVRRGNEAEKIKWAREAGSTQEMQLSATRDSHQRELIAEVYGRNGTSSEVRAAVEAECVAEKEKAAQAAALMDAAAKLQGKPRPDANSPVDPAKK